jgi:fucose permease
LSAIAYAGMFVFGIVMALLGAVLPALSDRLMFSLADIGTLFLVMNAAMLVTSLFLGVAMDRFGMKTPLAAGPSLVAAGLLLITRAADYASLLPAVVCLGIGGGALNGATNTLVADLHEDPRRKNAALNLLGVFFGFGALLLPFLFGALLRVAGIGRLLQSTAVLCLLTGCAALALRFPAPKQPQRLPIDQMPRFLRMPVVLAMAILLFFQSGNEFLLGGYFSTFLTRATQTPAELASYLLAAYWASIMAARILLSRILLRAGAFVVIGVSAVLAAAGSILVAVSTTMPVAAAGIVLTGAALSGIFPTVLGLAGARFRQHSGSVFGILFTIALSGGMLMPWLAGQLAETIGLRSVFVQAAGSFLAIALLNFVVRRLDRPAKPPAAVVF